MLLVKNEILHILILRQLLLQQTKLKQKYDLQEKFLTKNKYCVLLDYFLPTK